MANGVIRTLSKISLGLVLVLFWIWAYLRAPQLFPLNTEAWKDILLTYILFASLVFGFNAIGSERTERPLFKVGFFKAFPKFLIAGAVSFGALYVLGLLVKGDALPSIFSAVSAVGVGVILLHAFFVATIEEFIFRGWLTNELSSRGMQKNAVWVIQAVVFAFFHYLLNGEWSTIILYIPLALIFMFIKERFSPVTNMANAGAHFAWNLFILGFFS